MKKTTLPWILLIASLLALGLNLFITRELSDLGFWARVSSSAITGALMIALIIERKKK